jgi:hypothetical protein
MKQAKGSLRWALAACLALQGCASIDAFLIGNESPLPESDPDSGVPQLPIYRDPSLLAESDEGALPLRPRNRVIKRPASKPRTELARAAVVSEPVAGEAPAEAPGEARPNIEVATVAPESAAPAPPPQDAAPIKLIGLDENELVALLGQPSEREDYAPGKLWRYRLANCTLTVSLYPEVRSLTFRALSYEVAINDDSATSKYGCFSQRELNALAK